MDHIPETTDQPTLEHPPATLRARIDELEALVARQQASIETLEEQLLRYRRLTEATFEGIVVQEHGRVADANPAMAAMLGYSLDELIGLEISALLTPESLPVLMQNAKRGFEEPYEVMGLRKDGSVFPAEICGKTIIVHGEVVRVAAVRDITERHAALLERQRLQDEIVAAHAQALAELSTPLLQISEGVLLMPLIGSIDTQRAQQVLEALLQGAAQYQAQVIILDISGTPIVDTAVANALIQAAQAVSLLGARAILTGIRPEVAQTIVTLGVQLSGIATHSSLQSGIAAALRTLR